MKDEYVGRYLQALCDSPMFIGSLRKGEYILMTSETTGRTKLNSSCNWSVNKDDQNFKLMPEGFNPDYIVEQLNPYVL